MNVMNKNKQILLIKDFIKSDEETLIINHVSEELLLFYMSIIRYYADQQGIKVNIDTNTDSIVIENDLFESKPIQVFNTTSAKKLNTIQNTHNKKIIFTDYKNYKKLNTKFISINGYQFEKDIIFFIKEELEIDNDELSFFCQNNPVLLFSETSKFFVNNYRYESDQAMIEEKNHILDIRKLIFELKKNNRNIKNLYLNIKKEAEYKRLSFLAY